MMLHVEPLTNMPSLERSVTFVFEHTTFKILKVLF